jgi:hypothetical protein
LTQLIWEASRSEAELMRLFRKFDRRGTGRISRRDFSNAVQKLGALFISFIGHGFFPDCSHVVNPMVFFLLSELRYTD